jgi:hypothetical protein
MKKVLLTLAAVACAASVFAQGTVVFNNRVTGTLITHVYLGGNSQLAGNGPTDLPAGSTAWGAEFVPLAGSGYTAALLAGPDLLQATPTTTFRTGTGAGFLAGITVTLQGVAKDAPSAQMQMVAWDNKGGTITDWTAAKAAWQAGQIAAGASPIFTVASIGGDFNVPPYMTGLQSFNIYLIPEPSTFALAGLGAAALMIFRRRK